MSDKKSYMNQSNLITEGFFDKLKTLLGFDSKKTKILKKDKKINQNLKLMVLLFVFLALFYQV